MATNEVIGMPTVPATESNNITFIKMLATEDKNLVKEMSMPLLVMALDKKLTILPIIQNPMIRVTMARSTFGA